MEPTTIDAVTDQTAVLQGPQLYEWVCLDLETTNASPDVLEHWMRYEWKPDKRNKAETIGKKYKELLTQKESKLALMNEAPVISVGLKSSTDEVRCIHSMQAHDARYDNGALVEGFATEREMLIALRSVLDGYCTPDTMIVGHNVRGFDLPKLRWRYVHHSLRLPDIINGKPLLYDTMLEYVNFSVDSKEKAYVSLQAIIEKLGLPSHKEVVTGAEIPALHDAGAYETIIKYQILDVLDESSLFLRMTGQLEGLE